MGRGKVQLKRIENKVSRQVTFSKRRRGVMKKASEISVLCDVHVSLIVFSANGKLFQYSSYSSMESILEVYQRQMQGASHTMKPINEEMERDWCEEHAKLASRLEDITKTVRNYSGEELESLSLRELQNVEQQIEGSLKRLRSRKHQLMQEAISEQRKRDKLLLDANKLLEKQLENVEFLGIEEPNTGQPCMASSIAIVSTLSGTNMENETVHHVKEKERIPISSTNSIPFWMLSNGPS